MQDFGGAEGESGAGSASGRSDAPGDRLAAPGSSEPGRRLEAPGDRVSGRGDLEGHRAAGRGSLEGGPRYLTASYPGVIDHMGMGHILDDPGKLQAGHSAAATSTTVAVHCGSGTRSPCSRKLSMW